jgi:hypothetical protein
MGAAYDIYERSTLKESVLIIPILLKMLDVILVYDIQYELTLEAYL